MSVDISGILRDWPYESGQISARKIKGDDGTEKIQLRLDLGLLQMETAGHPTGAGPHGHESLLDYYEYLLERYRQEAGTDENFTLDERACEILRNEAVMYYHRYLAEFILEDYTAVVRDTSRNLRLMDFFAAYASDESDRMVMEQYRPYVLMMRTRASGLLALRDDRPKSALSAVKKGVKDIQEYYRRYDEDKLEDSGSELAVLQALAKEIEEHIPPDPVTKIEKELALAVREERYEDAAGLRDELRHITSDPDLPDR